MAKSKAWWQERYDGPGEAGPEGPLQWPVLTHCPSLQYIRQRGPGCSHSGIHYLNTGAAVICFADVMQTCPSLTLVLMHRLQQDVNPGLGTISVWLALESFKR